MRADHSHDPISRLDLERWALGRLEPARVAELEAIRLEDPELDARMERVRSEIASAASDMPPLALPEDDQVAAPSFWRSLFQRPAFAGLALAAAAVIALVLLLPERVDPPVDTWRGAAVDVELFRVRLGEAASQGALVRAREGDRLQYTVTPGGAGWLQIYNLQDDGQVQAYLEPREVAAKLAVSSAVVLDSYAGTERIFILLSAEPISLEQVERAAEAAFHTPLADLDALPGLGAAVSQRSVLVIKESAP